MCQQNVDDVGKRTFVWLEYILVRTIYKLLDFLKNNHVETVNRHLNQQINSSHPKFLPFINCFKKN
jgi:hypothetical protein